MSYRQAILLIGHRPTWELQAIVRSLSMFPIFNNDEETQVLKAAQRILWEESK